MESFSKQMYIILNLKSSYRSYLDAFILKDVKNLFDEILRKEYTYEKKVDWRVTTNPSPQNQN